MLIIARFLVVGLIATGIHMSVAIASIIAFDITIYISNLIGFSVAFIFSIIGQHRWTFNCNKRIRYTFPKFFLVSFMGFIVNNLTIFNLIKHGVDNEVFTIALSTLVVPAVTFLLGKTWVFQKAEKL